MHYLIFIPGKQGADRQHLIDAGLGSLLSAKDDSPIATDLEGYGPEGKPGQIWAWMNDGKTPQVTGFKPDRQKWLPERRAGGPRYWIGFDLVEPVKPIDIVRRRPIPGYQVRLADGQSWLLPNVMELPAKVDLDDEGRPVCRPLSEFDLFVAETAAGLNAWISYFEGEPSGWSRDRCFQYLVYALSINYRVNTELVTRLELLTTDQFWVLIGKTLDVERLKSTIEEIQKKSSLPIPDGSPPSDGREG